MRLAANHRMAARRVAHMRRAMAWLSGALVALAAASAAADTQRLSLEARWNLISFAVVPSNPAPAAVLAPLGANFEALWAYDAASGEWSRYPQAAPDTATINAIEPGRGYWLKVTNAATLDVVGADGALAPGPAAVAPDWNLVGFPLLEKTAYERIISNAAIRQIWSYDAQTGVFEGVVIDAQGLFTREDFIDLEPGRGYWILSNTSTSLAPELGTSLPTDLDLPPILSNVSVTESLPWTTISPGDVDVARDGNYDRSATQRGLDFGDRIFEHQLTITNEGSGLLAFRVAVADPETCPWLHILETDAGDGSTTRLAELSGSVTSERARIALIATRDEMGIGEHECLLVVQSNGAGPEDAERSITVRMRVGDLEGDYRLRVEYDSVDGKSADLANPRVTLSLYEDAGGLKGILDSFRTLLIPSDVHLSGRLIESGTTRFEISGSFETAADDPANPFGAPVRRDVTIRGTRVDRSAADGAIMGSLDLRGEYFETIRNVTAEPIRLEGTFTGSRLSSFATVRDRAERIDSASTDVPDNGMIEPKLSVTDRLLVDEVDVTLKLTHELPSDLFVSLVAPDGTEVVLRDASEAPLFNQIYDEYAVPLESLAAFDGKQADGDWTLRVADQVENAVTGVLLEWSLDIRGTEVHDIAGTSGAGLPTGSVLVLTGCGRTELATTAADRSFRFADLIDCVYRIAVQQPGFGTGVQDLVLAGGDIEGVVFDPPARPPAEARDDRAPASAQAVFLSLTTAGGAGATEPAEALQYALDAATFDLDRPPRDAGSPGPEDSNAFLNVLDVPDLTGSNAPGDNAVLDGPVGANSRRITLNLGMPVIGRSVQGDLRLSVGANP